MTVSGQAAATRAATTAERLVELRARLDRLERGEPTTPSDVERARDHAASQQRAASVAQERLMITHRSVLDRHLRHVERSGDATRRREAMHRSHDAIRRYQGLDRSRSVREPKNRRIAAEVMYHSTHSGVTLVRPHQLTTVASSDDLAARVDALKVRLGEGPCLSAATSVPLIVVQDLSLDERWPRFGPLCVSETGVRSVLSVRLPIGGEDYAAINWYAPDVDAFDEDDIGTSSVLAPFAALSVEAHLRRTDVDNLTKALHSSRQIGTAIGILMAEHKVSYDTAFAMLRRVSNDLNRKLRDVAADVETTGDLPRSLPPLTLD